MRSVGKNGDVKGLVPSSVQGTRPNILSRRWVEPAGGVGKVSAGVGAARGVGIGKGVAMEAGDGVAVGLEAGPVAVGLGRSRGAAVGAGVYVGRGVYVGKGGAVTTNRSTAFGAAGAGV